MAALRKTSLHLAWVKHWNVLFPDHPKWETALPIWLRANAWRCSPADVLVTPLSDSDDLPIWIAKLDVHADANGIDLSIAESDLGRVHWFSTLPAPYNPRWSPAHSDHYDPIKLLCQCTNRSDAEFRKHLNETVGLLRVVALRLGKFIEQELAFKIQIGHLEAWGLDTQSGAEVGGVSIVNLLNTGRSLDLMNNSLSGLMPSFSLGNIKICKGPFVDTSAKLPKSFEPFDHALFKRMQKMILEGHVPSVRQAAKQLAPLALRRGNMDSAERRLEEQYPY
ncbi:MAG: hypothetical protein AAGF25_12700 [Pseudomonadota bacterium]